LFSNKNADLSYCDPRIAKWHGQFPRESAENWIRDNIPSHEAMCHIGRSVDCFVDQQAAVSRSGRIFSIRAEPAILRGN
jgi:hypothetical protein